MLCLTVVLSKPPDDPPAAVRAGGRAGEPVFKDGKTPPADQDGPAGRADCITSIGDIDVPAVDVFQPGLQADAACLEDGGGRGGPDARQEIGRASCRERVSSVV